MALSKGKHNVKEIGGVFCTVVESGITENRLSFLKDLLELNNLEVKTEEDKNENTSEKLFTIGVTDLVFNPVIAVYERSLLKKDGTPVSPAYWNQTEEIHDLPYFEYRMKNPDAINQDEFLPLSWSIRSV